ncbi:MAG: ATP-binding protein [Magnetococcales bacterium]|nr:ATP-binding protein [Magnetococcales bacterium]
MGNVAALRNVGALAEVVEYITSREEHLPGLGCYYGPSGYGKSTAAAYVHAQYQGIFVELGSTWNRKYLLQQILRQMGVERPSGTLPELMEEVCRILSGIRKPLILDEADILVAKGLVDMVLEIHQKTVKPVIVLIGEEKLKDKLRSWEKVHNRFLRWEAAVAADLEDGKALRDLYCRKVEVADDLLEAICIASQWVPRRICVNLSMAQESAINQGAERIDLARWGKGSFYTGHAPERRVA